MERPLNVLVVEDSETVRQYLTVSITETDKKVTVSTAHSLVEAIIWLKSNRADVVLLDLLLPDAEDIQAVEKIQELNPDLPIVVLSGLGVPMEQRVMEAGVQDYLVKGSDDAMPGNIVRSLRHAVIRNEIQRRFMQAHQGLDKTKLAIEKCEEIEAQKDLTR